MMRLLRGLVNILGREKDIWRKLGFTEDAAWSMAIEKGISLKPTNQSPFGTKKQAGLISPAE